MAGNSPNLNTGASTAVSTATKPQNQYTREFFLAHINQDISNIENSHSDTKTMQYPSDIGRYYMSLQVSDYSRKGTDLFSVHLDTVSIIRLPLPKQMVDHSGVTYEQKELSTFVGGLTSAAMDAVAGKGSASSFLNGLAGAAGALGIGAAGWVQSKTGIPAEDLLRATTGLAPNQFLTVLLKGPQYKKHQFSWTFSPRNKAESESLRKIIANLNEYKAPGLAGGGMFFTFPKVFELSFAPTPRMLYRFLPAVIEDMTVNYAPSAPAFYTGTDAPSAIELTLNFLELEFWLSGRNQYEI